MDANKLTNFTKVLHKNDRASEVLVFDGQGNTSSVSPEDLVIGTATKLETPVQIDFQGDIQGVLSFNGSEETPVVSNITVKDNSHNHTVDNVSGLRGEIDSKVDIADYKDSDVKLKYESNADTNAFTDSEKSKLSTVETGAEVNTVNSVLGQVGDVDLDTDDIAEGLTNQYFTTDRARSSIGVSGDLNYSGGVISFNETYSTPSEIKTAYESNADTNAFTDSEKSKLSTVETGAEVNTVNSVNGYSGNVNLDKSDVGLSSVTNDVQLKRDSNLLDVPNKSFARTNLGLADVAATGNFADMSGEVTESQLSQELAEKVNDTLPYNLDATTAPTANDDINAGWKRGSLWIDTTSQKAYRCVDNTSGAAVWVDTSLSTSELATVALSGSYNDLNNKPSNATGTVSGFMSASDKVKLDTVETGAEVNTVNSVAGKTGLVTLNTSDVSEGANQYFTTARARAAISVSGDLTYSNGVISFNETYSTPVDIKTAYESNTDTNAFTDSEKSKLSGIEAGAEVNEPTNLGSSRTSVAYSVSSSTGSNTSLQAATTTLAGVMTAADKAKLDSVEEGAGVSNVDSVNGQTGTVSLSTDDIPEGNVNDYFTITRARNSISVTGDLNYSNGVISFNETYSTPSEVKTAYESNANTNVFTDSEKSKLSGIEAGAEVNDVEEAPIDGNQYARQDGGWSVVNQSYSSATELLDAIKTVDGSGSGLDADLLDGLDSSEFLRSNVDINNLRLSDYGVYYSGSSSANIDEAPVGDIGLYATSLAGTFPTGSSFFLITTQKQYSNNAVVQHATSYHVSNPVIAYRTTMSENPRVWTDWVKVYHTGNFDPSTKADKSYVDNELADKLDTTAKAADSDKLDGKEFGSNVGDVMAVGDFGIGTPNNGNQATDNVNDTTITGIYTAPGNSAIGWPGNTRYGSMLVMNRTSANLTVQQFLISQDAGEAWIRGKSNSGVWTEHKLYHTGNDGPGSGLDADTIDGYQAQDFAYPNQPQIANITLTGDFA